MRMLYFLSFVAAVSTLAQTLPPAGPVTLQQEWRAGYTYRQRISQQMDQQVKMPEAPAPVQQYLTQIQETKLDVEKGRADGGHFGNVAITGIRTRSGIGAAATEFDSRQPREEDGKHPMSVVFRSLIGAPIGYDIGHDGSVAKVAIPAPKEKTPATDEAAKQLDKIFRQALVQMKLHGLPKGPVDEGATWPEKRLSPLAGLGKLELAGTWTFVGYEKREEALCAVLSFKGTLRVSPELQPKTRLRILTAKGNVIGRVWFDFEAGVARRSQMAQDVKLRMIRTDETVSADGSNEISTKLRQMLIWELLSMEKR